MIFEFVVVHAPQVGEPVLELIRDRLRSALEANLNDVEENGLQRMITASFERAQPHPQEGSNTVLGFCLDLPDNTSSIREVVDDFADALVAEPISHAVKCEDPLLRAELAIRAEELFAVEMKLRRVLSVIYLHAYPSTDPYELLREETMQPIPSAKPQKEQMQKVAENQFFHLTFGQYVNLNQKPAIKDLAPLIRNTSTYEAFRAELLRQPVEHEDDSGFLAGLKERMDAIEKMRNAVAHNRTPSKKATGDYLNALPLVNQALDDYLAALSVDWRDAADEEMHWDSAARRAVECTMERAVWEEVAGTIQISDLDEPRMTTTISDRETLVTRLEGIAAHHFYANCPRADGEFLYECDASSVVEQVLSTYNDRLVDLFTRVIRDDG